MVDLSDWVFPIVVLLVCLTVMASAALGHYFCLRRMYSKDYGKAVTIINHERKRK